MVYDGKQLVYEALKSVRYHGYEDNRRFLSALQDLSGAYTKDRMVFSKCLDDQFLGICSRAMKANKDQTDFIITRASQYLQSNYLMADDGADRIAKEFVIAFARYGEKTETTPESAGAPEAVIAEAARAVEDFEAAKNSESKEADETEGALQGGGGVEAPAKIGAAVAAIMIILIIILSMSTGSYRVDGLHEKVQPKTIYNDEVGTCKLVTISEDVEPEDFALSYYKTCFEEGDSIHWIIDTKTNRTFMISGNGSTAIVCDYDYVKGEEESVELLGSGILHNTWIIYTDTNEIEKSGITIETEGGVSLSLPENWKKNDSSPTSYIGDYGEDQYALRVFDPMTKEEIWEEYTTQDYSWSGETVKNGVTCYWKELWSEPEDLEAKGEDNYTDGKWECNYYILTNPAIHIKLDGAISNETIKDIIMDSIRIK